MKHYQLCKTYGSARFLFDLLMDLRMRREYTLKEIAYIAKQKFVLEEIKAALLHKDTQSVCKMIQIIYGASLAHFEFINDYDWYIQHMLDIDNDIVLLYREIVTQVSPYAIYKWMQYGFEYIPTINDMKHAAKMSNLNHLKYIIMLYNKPCTIDIIQDILDNGLPGNDIEREQFQIFRFLIWAGATVNLQFILQCSSSCKFVLFLCKWYINLHPDFSFKDDEIYTDNLCSRIATNRPSIHKRKLIKYLFNMGCNPLYTLQGTCTTGDLWLLKYICKNIDAQSDVMNQALTFACSNSKLHLVKWLIGQGADINCEHDYCVRIAICKGYLELVKYLIDHGAKLDTWISNRKYYDRIEPDVEEYLRKILPKKL